MAWLLANSTKTGVPQKTFNLPHLSHHIMDLKMLPRDFYDRDPKLVAAELLGKVLIRDFGDKKAGGIIVETEAYYGMSDPASRASKGVTKLSKWLWEDAGTVFVYKVHGHSLLNIITERKGEPSGVLIRAIEPIFGINIMAKNRGLSVVGRNNRMLTSGPGRLTMALRIGPEHNGLKVYDENSPIRIYDRGLRVERDKIGRSHRIGVSMDMDEELRFFVLGNKYVSRYREYGRGYIV